MVQHWYFWNSYQDCQIVQCLLTIIIWSIDQVLLELWCFIKIYWTHTVLSKSPLPAPRCMEAPVPSLHRVYVGASAFLRLGVGMRRRIPTSGVGRRRRIPTPRRRKAPAPPYIQCREGAGASIHLGAGWGDLDRTDMIYKWLKFIESYTAVRNRSKIG